MRLGVYPLVAPTGVRIEVVGETRRDTLLGRGYREERHPPPPPLPSQGFTPSISAVAVLAPWDELRTANVKTYNIPGLEIVSDDDMQGCWLTCKRGWERGLEMGATHHLVLTDDLTLPEGFWEALQEVVALFPNSPISLMSVKTGAVKTLESGRHWCVSWGVLGAANVLPVRMISEFLEWEKENVEEWCPHDDARLTAWATATNVGVLTPVPCLVNHGEFPSVVKDIPEFGQKHSPASVYQPDVRGIDWTIGADDPVFIGISVERPDPWLKGGRSFPDLRLQEA